MGTMAENTRILGIDPGLNTTGYAVLELNGGPPRLREAGVIRSRSRRPLERRLADLHEGTSELIDSLNPCVMAVEELFSHYQRPRTAILMGHARGVICLAAATAEISVRHYAATQVKKMLTGSGRATKQQVQLAICREFSLSEPPEPADVADALAIALCHFYTDRNKVQIP